MRPTRHVISVLLLAGFATVGCSNGETSAEAASRDSTPVTPVKTASDSVPDATPPVTRPTSHADGEMAYRARQYSDATKIFEDYTARHPQNAGGHYMLAMAAWKGNDLTKAEKAFNAALTIDSLHLKSLMNLSRVLIEQKRFDEALDKLTRASEVEPASNEVHRLLGRTLHSQGKTDAAVEAYRRAIELDDRDVWSMNNLGLLFLEQQRADEALSLLVDAVQLRKDVAAFHNNLGMAFEHTGHLEDAAAAYNNALIADPRYEKAKQNLARLAAMKGDRQ